jgi:hydroxymethylbilane synthase
MLPAPGQGALAVEAATNLDSDIRSVLTRLDHAATRAEVLAERRFLAVLEAGCTAPVGALAEVTSAQVGDDRSVRDAGTDLTLTAVIGRTKGDDGSQLVTVSGSGSCADPAELGERLARQVLSIIDPADLRNEYEDHN